MGQAPLTSVNHITPHLFSLLTKWQTFTDTPPLGTLFAHISVSAIRRHLNTDYKNKYILMLTRIQPNNHPLVMNLKPLADRVIILPSPAEEVTVAGIIIPDSAKEKPLKGTVMAVGTGTKDEEMVLHEGDTVIYGKYAGNEVEYDGEKYIIMRQSDVLAVVKV